MPRISSWRSIIKVHLIIFAKCPRVPGPIIIFNYHFHIYFITKAIGIFLGGFRILLVRNVFSWEAAVVVKRLRLCAQDVSSNPGKKEEIFSLTALTVATVKTIAKSLFTIT